MGVDCYAVLGISRNASKDEVKKAYKSLARRWHPDKNPNKQEEATRRFKEVSEAYQVLVDESKRRTYDQAADATSTSRTTTSHGFPRPSDFNYPETRSFSRQRPRYSASDLLGETTTGFTTGSRSTGGQHFTFSFVFKQPDEVFKEFFEGCDPFEDFVRFDPFQDMLGFGYGRILHSGRPGLRTGQAEYGGLAQGGLLDQLDEVEQLLGCLGLGGGRARPAAATRIPTCSHVHRSHHPGLTTRRRFV